MESNDLKKSPGARIRYLMDLHGFSSDYAMARATGLDRGTIRNILNRDRIGPKAASAIALALNMPAAWVESGFGPMRHGEAPGPDSSAWEVGDSQVREVTLDDTPVRESSLAAPPLTQTDVGDFVFMRKTKARLSAGSGLIPDEGWEGEPYAFRRSWLKRVATSLNNVVLMEIEGDSMSPTLQNRNMALVDLGRRQFQPGKLFAIRLGEIIQIKRLDISPDGTVLIYSDNPLYASQICAFDDLDIIGKLIWSARTWA
jgi:phage repressor protein C with HTH and peptisase S24 domain